MFHSLWCLGAQRKGMVIYMIRGVHFKIPQKMDNIIFNILCCLNVESYYWFKISSQTEVWGEQIEEDFFEKEFYKGDEFLNIIKNKHRIIFLKIQGYLKECDIKNIHTYKEFVDSNCNIIILIYDCEFVEIYSKNESTSILLFRRAKALVYKSCGYITDDNDSRTKMDVL